MALLITIPALVAGMVTSIAFAQAIPAASTVDVRPVGTSKSSPDGGNWFVQDLAPGQTANFQLRLFNPTNTTHDLQLFLADMTFDANGTPSVANSSTDVGTWGRFEHPTARIAPHQTLFESFSLKAPAGADPGDHIGAVVVQQEAEGTGSIRSIERVALRVYITLPGDARKDFQIDKVTAGRRSVFYPRKLDVTVWLRNTGRVRLSPNVTVNGTTAKGSVLLVSQSVEHFTATQRVPFWGGPVMLHVAAQSTLLGQPGPTHQANVLIWVIPWHLIALLALLIALALLVRRQLRKRGAKVDALKSDLRRIERLITEQHVAATHSTPAAAPDPQTAIKMAMKQARRTGDKQTAERLAAMQAEARQSPKANDEQAAARIAIFTAAKQARSAGDIETAKRLEKYLAETARQLNADEQSPPSTSHGTG